MYDWIVNSTTAKGVKHTLPYPSLINHVVKMGFPLVFEHDKILPIPTLGKSFSPVCGKPLPLSVMDVPTTGEALASNVPSSLTVPSVPLEGQCRFEKVVIDVLSAMTEVLKSSEARPDVPTDGDFSSSSTGDGAFSVHSLMLSPSNMDVDPSVADIHDPSILESNV
uniref:Uncharacterized protein n=1 Tax=Cannabis sativa TaxID=3483 RepID=A0A803NJ85_CANSA